MPTVTRFHFEDGGQDLTWMDVNSDGVISDCGPFHQRVYTGWVCYSHHEYSTPERGYPKVGGFLKVSKSADDYITTIKYPVVKIENVEVSA